MFNKLTYESMEALSLYLHCLIGNPTGKEIRPFLMQIIDKLNELYFRDLVSLSPKKNEAIKVFYNSIARSSNCIGVARSLDNWKKVLITLAANDDARPLKDITASEWETLFHQWMETEEDTVELYSRLKEEDLK